MPVPFCCDKSTLLAKLNVLPVALILPRVTIWLLLFVKVELLAVLVKVNTEAFNAPDCVKPPTTLFVKVKDWSVASIAPNTLILLLALVSVVLPAVLVNIKVFAVNEPDCVKPDAMLSVNAKVWPAALMVPKMLIWLPLSVKVLLLAVFVKTKVLAVNAPDCVKPPTTLSTKVKVLPAALMVPNMLILFVALSKVVLAAVLLTFKVVTLMSPAGCVMAPVLVKLSELPLMLALKVIVLFVPVVVSEIAPPLVVIPETVSTVPIVKLSALVKLNP